MDVDEYTKLLRMAKCGKYTISFTQPGKPNRKARSVKKGEETINIVANRQSSLGLVTELSRTKD
jgi:hypothetical protein